MTSDTILGMVPTDDGYSTWIFSKHPDGMVVSVRKATQAELDALRTIPTEDVTDHVALMEKIKGDTPEWSAVEAGYDCVTDLEPHMRKVGSQYMWMGYAVRAAFVAGARWQRNQEQRPKTLEERERARLDGIDQ